jgi:hypothetical protein
LLATTISASARSASSLPTDSDFDFLNRFIRPTRPAPVLIRSSPIRYGLIPFTVVCGASGAPDAPRAWGLIGCEREEPVFYSKFEPTGIDDRYDRDHCRDIIRPRAETNRVAKNRDLTMNWRSIGVGLNRWQESGERGYERPESSRPYSFRYHSISFPLLKTVLHTTWSARAETSLRERPGTRLQVRRPVCRPAWPNPGGARYWFASAGPLRSRACHQEIRWERYTVEAQASAMAILYREALACR